jgi:Chaperone of endosialidase
MKTTIPSFLITLLIASVEPSQNAHAVSPPPDGGYPGGNTAEGTNALFSLTSGTYNTAVGLASLSNNRTGNSNTAIGAGALSTNTASENTATGALALLDNTTGNKNTADGNNALSNNIGGSSNTATGDSALFKNTGGDANTANGANALFNNIRGGRNTANGAGALLSNVSGNFNTAEGASALANNTTGNGNIALGAGAGANVSSASNVICIGTDGANVSNGCYIGRIFGVTVAGAGVFINSNGKIGTATSSRRFKDGIKPIDNASQALYALKPVSFRYKKEIDPNGVPQFGLVAEDVEQIDPDLVVRDKDDKAYSVRYDQINAMLLNEFLKEHAEVEEQKCKIQRQEATITELKNGIKALVARIEEQDAKIQSVSDQLETSSSASRAVASNQ